MSAFAYKSTRELASGSSPDEQQNRDFRLLTTRPTRRPIKKQNTALSGEVESLLYRSEKHYACQTEAITPGSNLDDYLLEFLASVENGEGFTFDRYGTVASPDDPVDCIMVSKTYPVTETGKKYNRYRFVIREI